MQASAPDSSAGHGLISIVTETYPPEVNGVAHTLLRLSEGMQARGHDIQVVRPSQKQESQNSDTDTHKLILAPGLPIPGYSDLRFGLPIKNQLIRAWKERRPHSVYIATEGPLGSSALAAARKLGIPVASGFHTRFDEYTRHYRVGFMEPVVRGWLRRFHNRCDMTLVPTRELQGILESQGFENVRRLSRGVDTSLFSPERRDPGLRSDWGLADDELALIYVGRLAAEKNIALAVKTYQAIRDQIPGTRLVLVGDGPIREDLSRRHPDIIFAGMHRGESLARHYASGDLFLFPSLSETFGNVVIEAMASGLPVLGYNEAAVKEHILPETNGISVTPGDEEAFVTAGLNMARRSRQLSEYGVQARQDSLEQDWSHIFQKFEKLLNEIREEQRHEPAPAYE